MWNKEQGVLPPVIVTERIGYLYHPGTPLEKKALEQVSLQIEEGECIGIVGETGSGKTTLIQHLNGLLRPSSGKIWVEGVEIGRSGISWGKLRQRVGLIFQPFIAYAPTCVPQDGTSLQEFIAWRKGYRY